MVVDRQSAAAVVETLWPRATSVRRGLWLQLADVLVIIII